MKSSKLFVFGLLCSVIISLIGFTSCAQSSKPSVEKDGGLRIIMEVSVPNVSNDAVVDNTIGVLRSRIERFGITADPTIRKIASNRILIELPGVTELERIERLEKLLLSNGDLSFWETYNLDEIAENMAQIDKALTADKSEPKRLMDLFTAAGVFGAPIVGTAHFSDTAEINRLINSPLAQSILPRNARFFWEVKSIDDRGLYYRLISLKSQRGGRPSLEGDVITDARAEFGQFNGRAEVLMKMNDEGARKWADMTKENIGRSIAIVLDGYVYSYPTVQSEITGGSSQISGNFTKDEAKDLANTLKSGRMPAPAHIIQTQIFEPAK